MKKTIGIILLVAISFAAGILMSDLFKPVKADQQKTLNRSTELKYDPIFSRRNCVYISSDNVNDPYYHEDEYCEMCLPGFKLGSVSFFEITRYEAVERGFLPCPDCVFDYVRIK